MATDKKLRVGVIGVGHLGKEHARIYSTLPFTQLIGLADIDPSKEVKAQELDTQFFMDYRSLIQKVDAVSIVTPTSSHHEIAKACLQSNVHTLIEKPITSKLEEADELIELARKRNLALQVGHLERYNVGFKHVEKIAKNIRFLEIHRLSPFTPRVKDCGVVLDMMIHDLDILQQLIKSPVKSIDCVGITVLTKYEDIANVRIRFENGAVANVTASRLTPEKQRKIRIFQEDAYISLDFQAQSAQIFRKALFGIKKEVITLEKEESLKAELEDFVGSILNKRSLGKPDVQARNALALALQITAAIKKNENAAVPVHA